MRPLLHICNHFVTPVNPFFRPVQLVANNETLATQHLHIVVLRKISSDIEKIRQAIKKKHKNMYLHSMSVKMAASSSKVVSK